MKKFFLLLLAFTVAWPALATTKNVTFAVKGWTCGSCAASTRIALKKLEGVEDVKTDQEKMEAVVTYDDSKVTPERMIQAIEKLGYKATAKAAAPSSAASLSSGKDTALGAPPFPERVSFFGVPLACCAAEGLGCGSLAKPILKELERNPKIAEAWIDYPGTTLAIVWKDAAQSRSGVTVVEAAFKKHDLEVAPLPEPAREKAFKDFQSKRWYRADDVDRLSKREARVIASRLVGRVEKRLGLSRERLTALTEDLSAVIAQALTKERDEECASGKHELDLTRVASKYLNPEQMAEFRRSAEQGIEALPGETK